MSFAQHAQIALTVAGLCTFEVVSSLDNAVLNAEVLGTMSPRARRWFFLDMRGGAHVSVVRTDADTASRLGVAKGDRGRTMVGRVAPRLLGLAEVFGGRVRNGRPARVEIRG